jgi:hypothetical protein
VLDLKADLYFGEPQAYNGANHPTFGAPGTSVGTVPSYSPETSWTGFGTLFTSQHNAQRAILAFLKIIFYEERDSPLLPRKKDLPALVLQGRQRSGSQAVNCKQKANKEAGEDHGYAKHGATEKSSTLQESSRRSACRSKTKNMRGASRPSAVNPEAPRRAADSAALSSCLLCIVVGSAAEISVSFPEPRSSHRTAHH